MVQDAGTQTPARDNGIADAAAGALLARVRVVLVETSHPGNIGAAARAMKTMGLGQLWLVRPRIFPSAEATARASGADDLLQAATVVDTLADAVADCGLVLGTTARTRHLEWPVLTPRAAAAWSVAQPTTGDIALVFGREQSGLSNEELAQCQRAIRIPTSPDFSSLNIAQAVQICVYEMRLQALGEEVPLAPTADEPLATTGELAALVEHAKRVMEKVDYYKPDRPKLLPHRLQRLVARPGLTHSEVQILRGFLTKVEKSTGRG
jgi:tRNA (cytidine32/uridine32-2'-O)-methyltransferase